MAWSTAMLWLVACMTMATMTWAGEELSCDSWRFNVEVNNLQSWQRAPDKCERYVAVYMTGPAYAHDCEGAALAALGYAHDFLNSSSSSSITKYCWVFDVDETSLSNLPYFQHYGFGSKANNYTLAEAWIEKALVPPLPATLLLVHKLQKLGYSIFFLTGRDESLRAVTARNLATAGYKGWTDLLMRQKEDHGISTTLYKSKKRNGLEDMGYTIVGNVGDQWSDLTGYSVGNRVFKLPNPIYHVIS